jgi:MFS family permease
MLIIWLQGIWLPLHGYSFESTPLWAGIYLLPLTVGFVASGPVSGWLSDKYGTRRFAGTGLLIVAATFVGLLLLPCSATAAASAGRDADRHHVLPAAHLRAVPRRPRGGVRRRHGHDADRRCRLVRDRPEESPQA